jgi:hypothetical protein
VSALSGDAPIVDLPVLLVGRLRIGSPMAMELLVQGGTTGSAILTGRVEDRLRDTAGLIDDHQYVATTVAAAWAAFEARAANRFST